MATNSTLKDQLATKKDNTQIQSASTLNFKQLMQTPTMKKKFDEILDKKSSQFMASMLNLVNSETSLQKVEPMSIVSACMVAATLDLPVDKNLGYSWVVPYSGKASFQIGWKGYVQLALRTGQYKAINVVDIHEGELISWNPLTEELEVDFNKKKSDKIIGYAGYFELLNGFKKSTYWSKEQIEAHKRKFSKSDYGWKKDYDAMARKTVLRNILSKWGILSIEMQTAYTTDMREVKDISKGEDGIIDIQIEDSEIFEGEVLDK